MHGLCAQRERACHILRYPRFTLCESYVTIIVVRSKGTRHDCAEKGTRGLSKLSIVSFHSRLGFTVGDNIFSFARFLPSFIAYTIETINSSYEIRSTYLDKVRAKLIHTNRSYLP